MRRVHLHVSQWSHRQNRVHQLLRHLTTTGFPESLMEVAALKNPYDDGTSHVVLSPLEFVGRLAAR
ncbi:MAG TPA: hypothetical protein EYG52_08420 [Pseudomonadales bacterium]|jgi:hypothetical protein|nr:hypothetical protein [Pseudomonadales bacterium]